MFPKRILEPAASWLYRSCQRMPFFGGVRDLKGSSIDRRFLSDLNDFFVFFASAVKLSTVDERSRFFRNIESNSITS
ncbi:hypothetical protein D3C84_820520 [compost metagenome]